MEWKICRFTVVSIHWYRLQKVFNKHEFFMKLGSKGIKKCEIVIKLYNM